MYVISLIVKNEFGVMQRVMGEFTRNKINVETIVVGKCEVPGKSRMVLSVIDKGEAELAMGRNCRMSTVRNWSPSPDSPHMRSFRLLTATSEWSEGLIRSRRS